MTELIINIALLTLLFTAAVGGTLILRSTLTRGRESVICVVWAAVLIISVVPIYSSYAAIIRLPALNKATADERLDIVYATEQGGYKTLSDVERDCERVRKIYGGTLTAVEYDTGGHRSAVEANGEQLDFISALCYMLFAVWLSGAFVCFIRPFLDFFAVSRTLTLNSDRCENRHINELFESCRHELGIKRNIPLRIAREGCLCSPCTAGLMCPRVFISADCLFCGDEQLRFIFTHELCHIARGDLVLKMFTLTVCALHWFNPLSRLVPKLVGQDCELACDGAVLKLYGRDKYDSYMFTILDIAESLYRPNCRAKMKVPAGGLFISGDGGRRFLERRYDTMKLTKTKKAAAAFASIFIAVLIMLNSVIMSSCGTEKFKEALGSGNVFLDEALRGYYGLTAEEDITAEMLGAITDFTVSYSGLNLLDGRDRCSALNEDGYIYVDYIINGKTIPAFRVNEGIARYEEMVKTVGTYYNPEDYTSNEAYKIINAFYCLRDEYDPELTAEQAQIISEIAKALIPAVTLNSKDYSRGEEQFRLYIFDYYSSDREIDVIAHYMEESGLLENYKLLNGIFDASCLDALPNLQSVSYLGVTPVNESERVASLSKTEGFTPVGLLGDYTTRMGAVIGKFNELYALGAAKP